MADEITVDGATYYRDGSGWRLRGARDVAVGPRFCALLDEIAQLRAERDAAPKDAERLARLGRLMPVGLVRVEIAGVRRTFGWGPDSAVRSFALMLDDLEAAARAAEGGTTT